MAVCGAIKRDGGRCKASVKPGQQWCANHDPTRSEQRKQIASKAGKSKPSAELRDVKKQLQELTDHILSGKVERADAAVCGQLLNVKLRALEQERRWRELEEFDARLEAVEGVLKDRKETRAR
jgi:hypothetical protein